MATPGSLRHLMNDDALATHSSQSPRHSSAAPAQAARHSSAMDKVINRPTEIAAANLGDAPFSHWSSSAHPLIAEICNLSDEEAAEKIFQLTPSEYETIAFQLGYGHLDAEWTLPDTPADTTSRESSPTSSDFWTKYMKGETQVRERDEKAAKEHAWAFPPRDREMARRVIDKYFEGIHRFRPIMDEDAFKREYGRLSQANISIDGEFDPGFIACAHLVFALGTTVMDMEAQQTKSALVEVPIRGPPIPFLPSSGHPGHPKDEPLSTSLPSAAAMLDRAVPANNYVFPLGHSTLFDKDDVDKKTDGIGKVADIWPTASYLFQQGIRVSKAGTATSIQDLQKMLMVYTWYSCRVPVRALWRYVKPLDSSCRRSNLLGLLGWCVT
jgi:hypothetical protein